jgi:hypothetical protein
MPCRRCCTDLPEHDDDGEKADYHRRPPAVESSPVHMHCQLVMDVPLMPPSSSSTTTTTGIKNLDPTNADDLESPSMILLQADTYVIRGDVIWKRWDDAPTVRKTSTHGNHDVRDVDGRIDCLLLCPLASLGNARFCVVGRIYHTGRPIPSVGSDYGTCDVDRAIPLPLPAPTVNAPFEPQPPMFMDVKTGKHTQR